MWYGCMLHECVCYVHLKRMRNVRLIPLLVVLHVHYLVL